MFFMHLISYSMLEISFRIPPPANFAKTHTRLGRGRLEVGVRDLIPPRGTPGVRGRPVVGPGCAGAASCLGARGLCRGGGFPRGTRGGFSPGEKSFSGKNFPHAMYKEARGAGLRKVVDKASFGPIFWWF